jgi:hypothetical protein
MKILDKDGDGQVWRTVFLLLLLLLLLLPSYTHTDLRAGNQGWSDEDDETSPNARGGCCGGQVVA